MTVNDPSDDKGTDDDSQWLKDEPATVGRNTGNSPDGLNGTHTISQEIRTEFGLEDRDPIEIHVSANGDDRRTKTKVVSGGNQVTIPAEMRRQLNLEYGDEYTIWIRPRGPKASNSPSVNRDGSPRSPSGATDTGDDVEDDEDGQQTSLSDDPAGGDSGVNSSPVENGSTDSESTGESNSSPAYLTIHGEGHHPYTYHHPHSDAESLTRCGLNYSETETRTWMNDENLDRCYYCTIPEFGEESSVRDLKEWLGQVDGFDLNPKSSATFFLKTQVEKIVTGRLEERRWGNGERNEKLKLRKENSRYKEKWNDPDALRTRLRELEG